MGNPLYDKSLTYAVGIVELSDKLKKHDNTMADQLKRSGTSVGANVSEAQYAQGRKDFISKLSIALKEASESRYWLSLISQTNNATASDAQHLIRQIDEIIRILTTSIKTTKTKL